MNTRIATIQKESTCNTIDAIITAANQIRYNAASIAPHYSEMQNWEAKEYQTVLEDCKAEFNILSSLMMNNESIFNQYLCKYNMSVSIFIALLSA